MKLGCTLGMLLCLDRDHRLAYVLSDVFEVPSADAAYVCDISPAAFRKRASRARKRLQDFVAEHCGLVNRSAKCRCQRRVATAVRIGRVRPDALQFAPHLDAETAVGEMEELHDLASLMRSHPVYAAPESTRNALQTVIDSGRYKVLEEGTRSARADPVAHQASEGTQVGQSRVESHPAHDLLGRRNHDIGYDSGTSVTPDYSAHSSRFTGKLHWVQPDTGVDDHDPRNGSASPWPGSSTAPLAARVDLMGEDCP